MLWLKVSDAMFKELKEFPYDTCVPDAGHYVTDRFHVYLGGISKKWRVYDDETKELESSMLFDHLADALRWASSHLPSS